MSGTEHFLRMDILEASRHMEAEGHSPGTSGNVSARFGAGLLITQTGVEPSELTADDIVALDAEGTPHEGQRTPPPSRRCIRPCMQRGRM